MYCDYSLAEATAKCTFAMEQCSCSRQKSSLCSASDDRRYRGVGDLIRATSHINSFLCNCHAGITKPSASLLRASLGMVQTEHCYIDSFSCQVIWLRLELICPKYV